MSWVTNISGGPLDVPLLDTVVEDGQTVEVPDSMPGGVLPDGSDAPPVNVVWPSNRWEPAADPAASKQSKASSSEDAG